jgi:hypothetical protein
MATVLARRRREHRHPAGAVELLRAPERIRFACNPFENSRWWHADARTRGADGLLVAKTISDRNAIDTYAHEVRRILHLPIAELNAFVQEDGRMLLLQKDISRDQPWDEPTGRTRPIVIPTVLRRCLSNLVADVLETTCDHLLPDSAVAYRPGSADVVAETLIDVATDVHFGGKVFHWKFDLRNAFPSLPWPGVAEALAAIGYPPAFVEVVMALVKAPIVRHVKGRRVVVPNDRGCPVGLPESAILLNIFLKPLDEILGRQFPQVTYRRYSDDGIVVGAQRHIVVGAVRRTLVWAREHDVRLKSIHPDQGAASLVRDAREAPIPFLGAEIHADGDIRVPPEKVDRQIAKLRFMLDHTPEVSGAFEVIAGVSKYATDGRRCGVRAYDREDLQQSFEQFFSYAFALNEGDAMTFLDRVRRELGINPQLPPPSYPSLVWVAALGDPGAMQAGGPGNLHRNHPELLKAWFLSVVRKDGEQIDLSEVDGSLSGCASKWTSGTSAHLDEEEVGVPTDLETWMADGGDDRAVGDHSLLEEDGSDALSVGFSHEEVDGCSSFRMVGEEASLEALSPLTVSETDRSLRSVRFTPVTPVCTSSGAVDPAQQPEPPGRCDLDNAFVVHVVARRIGRRNANGGTVVGVQLHGEAGARPQLRYFYGRHEEAAVIDMIAALRDKAQRVGRRAVLVLLDHAALPKTLLRRDRAFRRPALLARVLELHAPHPVCVTVAGPWAAPSPLAASVRDACEARARVLQEQARILRTRRRASRGSLQ